MEKVYISDVIDIGQFKLGQFNIVASGTGTGKTEFVRRTLLTKYPEISPGQILYVTSRSMIRDQQGLLDGINRMNYEAEEVVEYWNGNEDLKAISDSGIWIMNYNQLIHILDWWVPDVGRQLENIRIAIFDECHAMLCDNYIEGMSTVRLWIRERVREEKVLLLGLTATPGIMLQEGNGRRIAKGKVVNDIYVVNYKAKKLTVTTYNNLPALYYNRFEGDKTIILCKTIRDCEDLKRRIRNSVVLVAQKNIKFTERMKLLRDYILNNNRLPDTTAVLGDRGDDEYPIDVLITTSSMREGINLNEESGIKNVICCLSDEIHVKQFMGRCRFNVENLVVVNTSMKSSQIGRDHYIENSRYSFANYIHNKNDRIWFDSISDIVECSFEEVDRYMIDSEDDKFIEWLDAKCVIRQDMTDEEKEERYLSKYGLIDVIEKAYECRLFGQEPKVYTFNAVISYVRTRLGYRVETRRKTSGDNRYTYKAIYKE